MGRTMEYLLRQRHRLTLWERHPKPGATPVDLDSVAAEQDFILFCLPANPHFELASRLRPRLRRDSVCLSVAKGLDEQGHTAAQALTDALGATAAFSVLYGPMISEEIRDGRPAFAQAGTTHAETYGRVRELFAGTPLYIEHTTDIAGISWSAVLKNVYAILFGVADELGLGDNTRGTSPWRPWTSWSGSSPGSADGRKPRGGSPGWATLSLPPPAPARIITRSANGWPGAKRR
jgi:glycerol-3-phosphate dehydrogenase (NAD(P)+)